MNKKHKLAMIIALVMIGLRLFTQNADSENNSGKVVSMDGDWVGRLSEKIGSLKVVLHIKSMPTGKLEGTLDSPDQGAYGFPLTSIEIKGDTFSFAIAALDVKYEGRKDDQKNEISGTFIQRGMTSELKLQLLQSVTAKLPAELNFKYSSTIPDDFRPETSQEECKISLKNKTKDYICLGQLNPDGNLLFGWSDGKAGMPVFFISPNCQTNPQNPYSMSVGSAFVVLSISGKLHGYGKPSKAGNYELVIE